MNFYKGEDRILYIKVNGTFMPVGCLTSNSISENSEMLDTTTRDNDGWKTSRPTNQDFSISFEGIQVNSTVAGGNFSVASYDRLKILKRDRILIDWRIEGVKHPIVDFGKGYITNISETSTVEEFLTFSGSIVGYGKPLFKQKGEVLLNTGDPNEVIATNEEYNVILRTK